MRRVAVELDAYALTLRGIKRTVGDTLRWLLRGGLFKA